LEGPALYLPGGSPSDSTDRPRAEGGLTKAGAIGRSADADDWQVESDLYTYALLPSSCRT